MTAYTPHVDDIFDIGKPILGSTELEARDNLIAVAEQDSTAPKIRQKIAVDSFPDGGTITFDILDGFRGFTAEILTANADGTDDDLIMSLSDDGTTFYDATTIAVIPGTSGDLIIFLSMDTSTGDWRLIKQYADSSGTFANSSDDATHVRFTALGGQTELAIKLTSNGGDAA